MSYPHLNGDMDGYQTDPATQGSPFDAPVELVLNELSWLLADSAYVNLEVIMMGEYETVDDFRAEILINSSKFSSEALNRIMDEIDRVVDEYRRHVALTS